MNYIGFAYLPDLPYINSSNVDNILFVVDFSYDEEWINKLKFIIDNKENTYIVYAGIPRGRPGSFLKFVNYVNNNLKDEYIIGVTPFFDVINKNPEYDTENNIIRCIDEWLHENTNNIFIEDDINRKELYKNCRYPDEVVRRFSDNRITLKKYYIISNNTMNGVIKDVSQEKNKETNQEKKKKKKKWYKNKCDYCEAYTTIYNIEKCIFVCDELCDSKC